MTSQYAAPASRATPEAVADFKAENTRAARAALKGFELIRLADGSYIGAKPAWGRHIHLVDVAAVDRWLMHVGAV
jgi:hypothetical protein